MADELTMSLKQLRELNQVPQPELAKRLHIQQPNVWKAENRTETLKIPTLRAFLDALGYELEVYAVQDDRKIRLSL